MTKLSRRSIFRLVGGGLLASTAPAALLWSPPPVSVSRIVSALEDRLNARLDRADFYWSSAEVEDHKKLGGWPEYQAG